MEQYGTIGGDIILQIRIYLTDKLEQERFFLLCCVGLMESLLNKVLTVYDATILVFLPGTTFALRDMGIDEEIIDLYERGWELEDIESLLPHLLDKKFLIWKSQH